MSYFREHKEGFWGTIIFHVIILILLLLFGFFTPLPLPGEEGVMVDFGNSKQGAGKEEPAPAPQKSTPAVREEATPPVQANTPPPPPPQSSAKSVPVEAKQELMTQDYEKTVALEAAKKKKEAEAKKQQEELARQKQLADQKRKEDLERQRKEAAEAEAKRLAEIQKQKEIEAEKQRLAEIERQKQAELERQRKAAEEERLRKEAEAQKIAQINNRAANAFGSGSGAGSSDSKSSGPTYSGGNQGAPTGGNSSNYGTGGTGSGNSGNGPSFDLEGRNPLGQWPKPDYPGKEEGKVVVNIIVDRNGNVIRTEPGKGSTIITPALVKAAREAALKAKFTPSATGIAEQKGTITYHFTQN